MRKTRVDHTPQNKFWKNAMVGIGGLGMLLVVLLTQVHFSINKTQSLPYKIFICVHGIALHRGDFVSIHNHPTRYLGKIHYTKRLMGLPGDKILIHHKKAYINTRTGHNHLIGSLLQKTKDGKPLHSISETTIPEGYVFVSADHPRSFDSRYKEFGLVKQENIWGKCFGFFKCGEGQ